MTFFKSSTMYCAPGKGGNNTCFDDQAIIKMARAYNKEHRRPIALNQSANKIYQDLTKRLSKQCDQEICWIRQPFAKHLDRDIKENTFLTEHPSKDLDYKLGTSNIRKAMLQYQKAYPHFQSIGPVPSDFDEIYDELARINPLQLVKKGIYCVGIVFNTKPSTHPGEHWVAMFINLKQGEINYFDSYGEKPSPNIVRLIERVRAYESALFKGRHKFRVRHNWYPHQTDEFQCGAYCMNFIIESLKGTDFERFIKNTISDEQMKTKRMLLFRPHGL